MNQKNSEEGIGKGLIILVFICVFMCVAIFYDGYLGTGERKKENLEKIISLCTFHEELQDLRNWFMNLTDDKDFKKYKDIIIAKRDSIINAHIGVDAVPIATEGYRWWRSANGGGNGYIFEEILVNLNTEDVLASAKMRDVYDFVDKKKGSEEK